MSNSTRGFGGREFPVEQRVAKIEEFDSSDHRYQRRLNDNPYIRGKEIKLDMEACGATKFRDTIVALEVDGKLIVVDGFGRLAAAILLGWTEIDVDILIGRGKEKNAKLISLNANNHQVSQRSYTKREFQINAAVMFTEHRLNEEEVALAQGCTVEQAIDRIKEGKKYLDEDRDTDLSRRKSFNTPKDAATAAWKALNATLRLNLSDDNLTDASVRGALKDKYDMELRILAGNNEKQVKGLLVDLLNNRRSGLPTNFLVLFHICKPGEGMAPGHNALDNIKSLAQQFLKSGDQGRFFGDDLSSQEGDTLGDVKKLKEFAELCRKAMKSNRQTQAKFESLND
jgi:ParB-like chromosome segregation protein Spo0J